MRALSFGCLSSIVVFPLWSTKRRVELKRALWEGKREKAGIQVYYVGLEEAKASIDRKGANRRRRIPSANCRVSQLF